MTILITRPQEDAENLSRILQGHGLSTLIEPLLKIQNVIVPSAQIDLALDDCQGLLVTSANGVRAFARQSLNRDLAVWCVGNASADVATGLGFKHVHSANGDVVALTDLVKTQCDPKTGALLHVAGTRLAGDLGADLKEAGFGYRRLVMYEALKTTAFSTQALQQFSHNAISGVMMYSPRTAKAFMDIARHHGVQSSLASATAYCLSQAVADKLAVDLWAEVVVASEPTEENLIKMVIR